MKKDVDCANCDGSGCSNCYRSVGVEGERCAKPGCGVEREYHHAGWHAFVKANQIAEPWVHNSCEQPGCCPECPRFIPPAAPDKPDEAAPVVTDADVRLVSEVIKRGWNEAQMVAAGRLAGLKEAAAYVRALPLDPAGDK